MSLNVESLTRRFEGVFQPDQATVLAYAIHDAYSDLVKAGDFNELKEIVRDLAEAQQRTEARVEDLAAAQQRTEARVEELAVAQQELAVAQQEFAGALQGLAVAQQELTVAQRQTDNRLGKLIDVVANLALEVGGLSRSASYALENEAYRQLPAFLKAAHGIVLDERLVRTEIGGEEINIFALGQRSGTPIALVGETKLQLDRRRGGRTAAEQAVAQLQRKAAVVQAAYPDRQVAQLLVTHYARPAVRGVAQAHDVILIQSFEW